MRNLTYASAQGLVYFHDGRNNQDEVFGKTDDGLTIAIINDGCHGEGVSKNEVGAILSNRFLNKRGLQLLSDGLRPSEMPEILFQDYLDFLNWQVEAQWLDTQEEIDLFIANYLMCTTVGMAANVDEVCVFWSGDGLIYLNNGVYRSLRSANNKARYPAYNMYKRYGLIPEDTTSLVDTEGIEVVIPDRFETEIFPMSVVEFIGVASDGLLDHPHLMDELKAHASSRMSLQFCLNRIAMMRSETSDNVSVAFIQNKE